MKLLSLLLSCRRGLSLALALLAGCGSSDHLQEIRDAGVLRVITRNGPTTYYQDRGGPTGFEYQLAARFANHLGVKLQIEIDPSIDGLFGNLNRGRVDIAAAGLSVTPERQQHFQFGPAYMDIEQLVLVRSGGATPLSAADLKGLRIHLLAGSAGAETLRGMKDQFPELKWEESRDMETLDLLDQLDAGEIDATVINSNEYLANRAFYPNLRPAFRLGERTQLAWALAKDPRNKRLVEELEKFFQELKDNGKLAQMIEGYYTQSADNNKADTLEFTDKLQSTLPRYRDMIMQVADDYDLDWRLVAAISYAESEWKPTAVSPTGVRGLMMLTNITAKEMGVKNRVDPLQSLRGGARYFKIIRQEVPASITEPDRTWFALAAYNVGMGHVEDARIITQQHGKDPDKWADVKEFLPLLQKQQWYEKTKYGYARGKEPVRYVQNVRYYYNLLTWTEVAKQRTPPPKATDQYLPTVLDATFNAL
jgi:membrane-bound lytic murein transglycosylase F